MKVTNRLHESPVPSESACIIGQSLQPFDRTHANLIEVAVAAYEFNKLASPLFKLEKPVDLCLPDLLTSFAILRDP